MTIGRTSRLTANDYAIIRARFDLSKRNLPKIIARDYAISPVWLWKIVTRRNEKEPSSCPNLPSTNQSPKSP